MIKQNSFLLFTTKIISKLYFLSATVCSKSVKFSKLFMNAIIREFSIHSKNFYYKYEIYNKKNDVLGCNESIDNIAIILQGPIRYDNDFTINTVLRYKKLYPKIQVIISTWDDEKEEFFKRCDQLDICYIKNHFPENIEKINTHYQLYSTKKAIESLDDKQIDYVLKTRTDQRIYSECFLENLMTLIKTYPKLGNLDVKERLIFLNADASSYKYYAYHISDMFVFGNIKDMKCFYSIPMKSLKIVDNYDVVHGFDKKVNKLREIEHLTTLGIEDVYNIIDSYDDFINYKATVVAELYIIHSFIEILKGKKIVNNHLSEYWNFLAGYCCIVDKEILELYWPKYIFEYWSGLNSQKYGSLSHFNWLEIHNSMGNI